MAYGNLPLWRGPNNILGFILPTRISYFSNTNHVRCFWPEDNNIAFTRAQPHNYRVRKVEPCHQLG